MTMPAQHTTPTRQLFAEARVEVMDEIALLVYFDQEVRVMGSAFHEWEDPEAPTFKVAKPALRAFERVATDLLEAIFGSATVMPADIAKTRKKNLSLLEKVVPNVEELVRIEVKHSEGTGALGNHVRQKVLEPLNSLIAAWVAIPEGEADAK